jgi:hypothetical protein
MVEERNVFMFLRVFPLDQTFVSSQVLYSPCYSNLAMYYSVTKLRTEVLQHSINSCIDPHLGVIHENHQL